MDDFIVSARKYRPQTFDSVVGQENITETLVKAIRNNHLGNAFLFCGPRGVGKTTCARILAREVNQFHSDGTEDNSNFSFNIFELDAASNNSVEDIRNLIDQVRIPPQMGKYKVYIIDEVHMLSSSAFNAFLKTLEEPPAYAIFILATTEKHKVLPTIISRCQVFDFNRIQIADIVNHLAKIAKEEEIAIDGDALHLIAEKADGALRDALSIFDRMVSFAGNEISYQSVIDNLNILDYDYYFQVVDAFLEADRAEALLIFDRIINDGFDGHNFLSGLAHHIRNLLMATSRKTANIIEAGETIKTRYLDQSGRCDTAALVQALDILGTADTNYKASKSQRLLVEIVLLKLCGIFGGVEKKSPATESRTEIKASSPRPVQTPHSPPATASENTNAGTSTRNTKTEEVAKPSGEKAQPSPEKPSPAQSPAGPAEKSESKAHSSENDAAEVSEPAPERPAISTSKISRSEVPPIENPKQPDSSARTSPIENVQKKAAGSSLDKLKSAKIKGVPSLMSLRGDNPAKPQNVKSAEANEPAQVRENLPAEDFNLAELWEVWDAYSAKVKKAGKMSYYATLSKHRPVMREKYKVELLVDNSVQLDDLEKDKPDLLEFVRGRLQNHQIQLVGVIDDDDTANDDSLYDPHKKFEAMNATNPALGQMRAKFDLDVEHD